MLCVLCMLRRVDSEERMPQCFRCRGTCSWVPVQQGPQQPHCQQRQRRLLRCAMLSQQLHCTFTTAWGQRHQNGVRYDQSLRCNSTPAISNVDSSDRERIYRRPTRGRRFDKGLAFARIILLSEREVDSVRKQVHTWQQQACGIIMERAGPSHTE